MNFKIFMSIKLLYYNQMKNLLLDIEENYYYMHGNIYKILTTKLIVTDNNSMKFHNWEFSLFNFLFFV